MKSAITITKNESISFNDKLDGLLKLNQNYHFSINPNMSTEPNHVVLTTGYDGYDQYDNSFILSIDQLKELQSKIENVIYTIDKCKSSIISCSNSIDDLCSKIEEGVVKSVDLSVGEPCTLNPDEDFFGNMYMTCKYITKNGVEHVFDLISNEVVKDSSDVLDDIFRDYISKKLLDIYVFDTGRYNTNRDTILSIKDNGSSIDTKAIMDSLDNFEKEMLKNKH